jgi:hypothetical protein
MIERTHLLDVLAAGPETVVRLQESAAPIELSLPELEQEVNRLVAQHGCHTLAFDLDGTALVASSLLAFFVWLHNCGLKVQLRNTSKEVRDHLEVTKLDRLLHVRAE